LDGGVLMSFEVDLISWTAVGMWPFQPGKKDRFENKAPAIDRDPNECSGSMIPDTNVGGNIATINEVSDDQKTTFFFHQQGKGTPEGVAMAGDVERECSLHKKIIEASCCITIRQPPQPEALTLSTLQHRMTGWRIVRHRKMQLARLMQPSKFGFSELTTQKKGYNTDVRGMDS
jgi:hypothetical protein